MGLFNTIRMGASGSVEDLTIDRSARFRGATDQRFDRTLSSTSSSYTVSMWFKTVNVTTNFARGLFTLGPANNTDVAGVVFNTNDTLTFHGGNGTSAIVTTRSLRDTSAWYYFTYSVNSNNFTAYINGESLQTGTVRSLDTTSNGFRLGGWWGGYDLFRGYIADFYLIDGLALTPSSFTKTNVETGQLIPKKYTGSFGTSGAHLLFDDNSGTTATTLGKDSSDNGNNFTPNNFITGDSVQDSPTNNFPTMNALEPASRKAGTIKDGNLLLENGNHNLQRTNFFFGKGGITSGKWYWEVRNQNGTYASYVGLTSNLTEDSGEIMNSTDKNFIGSHTSKTFSASSGTGRTNQGSNKTMQFLLDVDNQELIAKYDGTTIFTDTNIPDAATTQYVPYVATTNDGSSGSLWADVIWNFGQDSTMAGNISANGNSDGNGIGDFHYSVPSGYLALCSANLPDPTIKLPNKHFDTLLYTGNNFDGTRAITGYNFQPDWIWTKNRTAATSHHLYDEVRGLGSGKEICTDKTQAEGGENGAAYGYMTSYGTGGFNTVKGSDSTNGNYNLNINGHSYAAWAWNGGGSTVTNNDGSISSQVRANTSAGFSIISWTGTGSNLTIGHGLGVKPSAHITKARTGSSGCPWFLYLSDFGANSNLRLNTTDAINSGAGQSDLYNDTEPTSSVITIGDSSCINENNGTYITYAFSEVAGYSKFGNYVGNGNADGTFIFTSFRPAWVLIKNSSSGSTDWILKDATIETFNVVDAALKANTSDAESSSLSSVDFLSNGFKIRNNGSFTNTNGNTYIYLAFAESPFKNSRAR